MSVIIQNLFFSPVKSISFTSSSSLNVKKNIGIKNDRIFALTRKINKSTAKIIEKNPVKRNLNNFLTLRNSPFLNKYNFDFNKDILIFKLKDKVILKIDTNDENNFSLLTKEIMKMESDIKETYLVKNLYYPFFDTTPNNSISLINLNSIYDFNNKVNKDIELARFRGNIYVNNLDPWQEFNLIGKKLLISNCKFKVTSSIPRCSATNLVPNLHKIDINIPLKLRQLYGHINMGVYLIPLSEGEIFINDKITIE